ncbi:hypothetical protein L7F22_047617 [Adiantum nelumboides]|nr:hypothetical protein [Adiantum nelumboides]
MRATPKMIDSKSFQEMLSTPVTFTITLSELLKIKPHLWEEMDKHLETKGVKIPLQTNPPMEEKKIWGRDYCEGNEGNTTLQVDYNRVKTIAILDSGAGVAIATKQIWDKWGRPALKKTRMKLQLADGYVEKPLSILEHIIVTLCGIDYEHTFTVVDFGKTKTFDVILGQPFMRQLKMIQDWGYDQIYLRHKKLVTKINMKDHSYRDVAKIPMQEFNTTTINGKEVPAWMQTKAHVWMCGASDCGDLTKEECILERPVTNEAYIPELFLEHLFEPFGWTQILSTLDICVNELTPTKFYDDEGYNLVTLQMASVIFELGSESDDQEESTPVIECKRIVNEISVIDIKKRAENEFMDSLSEDLSLLDDDLSIIEADEERSSESKSEWRLVKANDCVKNKVTVQFVKAKKRENNKKDKLERNRTKLSEGWEIRSGMTKIERKSEYNKLKKTLKDVWTTEMQTDEDTNSDKMDVPSHYKKYTIQDRKIIVQQPMRELKEPGKLCDGSEKAKKIDLAEPRGELKPAYIATDLTEEVEQLLIATLKQYRDVFVWSYKDLKGVDPSICQHTIPLKSDAKPSRQRPYTYNETFARKLKEKIYKFKKAKFIYEIEHTDWVSPIVVDPKKNEKLRVCINLKNVNTATIRDNYPLPIIDHVIERVAGREAYSFLDGFSSYNQLAIKLKDQHKMAFATEWGIFAYRVMLFGLTNAPATFQRLMSHAFKEYLRQFLEIYMDDLCMHSLIKMEHIEYLTKVYEKCRLYRICLNPKKSVFMVRQGKTLGHIVSKNGISTDMEKILVIVESPRPLRVKEVQAFMGHCGYYHRFIYLYAIIAKPLYALITKFEWMDECEQAFKILKQQLISTPIFKAMDWDKIFHIHVDASAFTIGCILAQPGEKNMDFPINYSSWQLNSAEKNYTTIEGRG